MSKDRTIFDDLDSDRFLSVKLKKAENARLIYVNYSLAIQLGYSLDKLKETLLEEYGLVVDDRDNSKSEIIGYADTYNASPLKPMRESGSGRGVFLKNGIFLKGVGLTPLAPLKGMKTKTLNTGFCPVYEGIKESVFGEFLHEHGSSSTRVLAVFDLGFKDDDKKNYTGIFDQGLIVRVGDHTRIAHYTDGTGFKEFEYNVGKHRPVDNWYKYKARFPLPELIQNQAKTLAAAEFRRFWHGAMDAGNTTMRGSLIDFGSATFQQDTAPRFWLNPDDFSWFSRESKKLFAKIGTFGYEYLGVEDNIKILYPELDIEIFHKELEHQRLLQLLGMFSFKEKEAEDFLADAKCEELIRSFYTSWWKLGRYFYWGNMDGRSSVANPLSLIDIFSYLRNATFSFYKMEKLPEIEVSKPSSLKSRQLDTWQKDPNFAAPYIAYGVQLDSSDQLIFSEQKSKDEFYQEKALINSKLDAVFNAFISYWQTKKENIQIRKQLLRDTVAFQSMPITTLSRGPLLENFKKVFANYKELGDINAIQDFIDQTILKTQNAEQQNPNDVNDKKATYFGTNTSPAFFQKSNSNIVKPCDLILSNRLPAGPS